LPATAAVSPVLRVDALSVEFATTDRVVAAVRDLSFSIDRGETVAVVGESGSGKSVTALSIMRLVEHGGGRIVDGHLHFMRPGGSTVDLARIDAATLRTIRGAEIAMIFQEPMTSLNPVFPVGEQIAESIRLHQGRNARAARAEALRMLDQVRIPEARSVLDRFPHQLSGGMRQRVMIAMALSCRPALLIADEPTTALDVTIQAQILTLIRLLQEEMHMAVMFITHDMGVVAEVADRVVVMYGGEKVEEGAAEAIFATPRQPYTRALLAAVPKLGALRGEDAPRKFPAARDGSAGARERAGGCATRRFAGFGRRARCGTARADERARLGRTRTRRGRTAAAGAQPHDAFRREVRLPRSRAPARARGRAGELRSRRRRNARARRRIGLRQIDDRTLASASRRHRERQRRIRRP
jgi:glutathione transport system ATP-binding protein